MVRRACCRQRACFIYTVHSAATDGIRRRPMKHSIAVFAGKIQIWACGIWRQWRSWPKNTGSLSLSLKKCPPIISPSSSVALRQRSRATPLEFSPEQCRMARCSFERGHLHAQALRPCALQLAPALPSRCTIPSTKRKGHPPRGQSGARAVPRTAPKKSEPIFSLSANRVLDRHAHF